MEPQEVVEIRELLMDHFGYDYALASRMAWAAYREMHEEGI